jgi:hypothetical protein
VTSDEVHLGGPGGVEGRSSSLSHHIMLKMALVDASCWLSGLGDEDKGSSWSRGLVEVIIIDSSLLLFFLGLSAFCNLVRLPVLLLLLLLPYPAWNFYPCSACCHEIKWRFGV